MIKVHQHMATPGDALTPQTILASRLRNSSLVAATVPQSQSASDCATFHAAMRVSAAAAYFDAICDPETRAWSEHFTVALCGGESEPRSGRSRKSVEVETYLQKRIHRVSIGPECWQAAFTGQNRG